MLFFRYYLLATFAVVVLWWPFRYLLSWFLYKRRVTKITRNMTAIDDYPLIGCALRFLGKNNKELMEVIENAFTKHQMPFLGWLGPKCFIVIDHPDDIQVVVNSKGCIEKSDIYRFFNRGVGLFAAPAHIWKPQRKQLSMSFSNQICWSFLPIFNQKANIIVRNIGEHAGKGSFDMLKYSAACTLDIVLETVLGTAMNIQTGENMHYMKALTDWLSVVARRMCNVFLHPDIIYKQTQLFQIESDALARSDAMQEKLILKKMEEFNDSSNNDKNDDDENKQFETPQIFIERLIKLRNCGIITDQEIRDQVHLIIFAGQDTSSYTIAMTLLMLAMHPKIEHRVINELNSVFGDSPVDCDLTMDHVNKLIYLEQVIKETLRVYPVAPLLLRHCTEDTVLPNFVIPKDTEVIISCFTAHRRKDIWGDDADEFNPDHFSREISSKRNSFAFMAFSNGPRNCLGRRFAFISIKTILAKLLRKYRFSTHLGKEDLKFQMEVTSKPICGIFLEIEERINIVY